MSNLRKITVHLIGMLSALILNSPVVNFEIHINLDRPSVESSGGERSCSKDNTFKIRGDVRLRSTNAISTRKVRIMYLGISKEIKRAMKVISKKRSRK